MWLNGVWCCMRKTVNALGKPDKSETFGARYITSSFHILLVPVFATVSWINHSARLQSPLNQSQRWCSERKKKEKKRDKKLSGACQGMRGEDVDASLKTARQQGPHSQTGGQDRVHLHSVQSFAFEKKKIPRSALPDVNVIWIKINFMMHSGGR